MCNNDQTVLFFKKIPNKTVKFKGEKCTGGKMSKERITILVGPNMTKSEREKNLLIFGKYKHPLCFKNITHNERVISSSFWENIFEH